MFPVSLDGTLPQWEFAVPKMKLSTSKLLKSLVILFSFETFSVKYFVVSFFLSTFAIDRTCHVVAGQVITSMESEG